MTDVYSEARVKEIVRDETADMRQELHRVGLMMEVMHDDIKVLLEVVSELWGVRDKVIGHGRHLEKLEDGQTLLRQAIADHERRLQAIG